MSPLMVLPRSYLAAMAATLLLGLVAVGPVSAVRPQPVANATLSARLCEMVVGYSWTKFQGRGLIATVGLYERTDSGDVVLSQQSFPDQIGRVGNVSFLASLTADLFPGGRTLVVIGDLTDTKSGSQVAGSSDESDTLESNCG